jgi:hypothetical protein
VKAGDAGGGGDDAAIGDDAGSDSSTPPSCDASPSWADGLTPTTTVYVSASAGTTQDGTPANPFKRIAQALPIAPWKRISLAGGFYSSEMLTDVVRAATGVKSSAMMKGTTTGVSSSVDTGAISWSGRSTSWFALDASPESVGINAMMAVTLTWSRITCDPDVHIAARDRVPAGGLRSDDPGRHGERCVQGRSDGRGTTIIARVAVSSSYVGVRRQVAPMTSRSPDTFTDVSRGMDRRQLAGDRFRPPLAPSGTPSIEHPRVRQRIDVSHDGVVQQLYESLVAANHPRCATGSPTQYVLHLLQEHGAINGKTFVWQETSR